MEEWIKLSLGTPAFSLTVLPAALLLGFLGAVGSCCNVAVIGALVGYSGAVSERKMDRNILLGGLSFMFGTIVALAAIGGAVGFVSQTVGSTVGMYWKMFAGAVMVFFGTASLDLLPFRLPNLLPRTRVVPEGTPQALIYGLAIGGGTTVCSASCNPVLPVVLGAAMLQGHALWGAAILGSFAFGYSLPLAAGMMGLSIGLTGLSAALNKYSAAIRALSGVLLTGVGLYMLLTA